MVIEACNSAIVVVGDNLAMSSDFHSAIIDFRDSSHGSIQIFWSAVNHFDGVAVIHGSLEHDPTTLDDNDVELSDYIVAKAAGSHLYTYKKLSFRYAQIRWTANSATAGMMRIKAMGKKT